MISNVKHIVFILFVLICFDNHIYANPLRITQEQETYTLDSHVFFYEDTQLSHSIDTIIKPENALLFSPSKNNTVSGGYGKSAYWTRIILHNTMTTPFSLSLDEHFPHLTEISFYLEKNGRILQTMHTGHNMPIPERVIVSPTFLFPFELPPGISTLYIRGTSEGSRTFEYTLFTQETQYKMVMQHQAAYNVTLGITAMGIFISLIFSIALREKSYLYLSAVNVAALFYLTLWLGLQPFYLPLIIRQKLPFLSLAFFAMLFTVFMAQFTLVFLSIKKREPIMYTTLIWTRNISFAIMISTMFLPYSYAVKVFLPYSIILMVFIWIGIVKIIRKNNNAIFYTIGFLVLFTTTMINAFALTGIISDHIIMEHAIPLGVIIQILLMQVAVATNVFRLYRKQISLQQKLLKSQEHIIQEQKILTNSYNRFVPHDFVQKLGKDNILDVEVGNYNQTNMFILFTDIRNFSTISYGMSPDKIFELTNTLFSFITPCVYERDGIIDKYTGDGIMAIYPITSSFNVIQSSIDMQEVIKNLAQKVQHITHHEIRMGIGINSGGVILGMVGDKSRINATVISSVVNTSAKIEKLNKHFGTNTLITEHTYNHVETPDDFFIRGLHKTHATKGIEQAVKLYEVFDSDSEEQKEQKLSIKTMFQEAMFLIDENKLDESITLLKECVSKAPLDIPAKHILQQAINSNLA